MCEERQVSVISSPLQAWLTPADVRAICALAQTAWDQAPASARCVRFRWRKIPLVSTRTNLRMLVNDAQGRAVCCRYQ